MTDLSELFLVLSTVFQNASQRGVKTYGFFGNFNLAIYIKVHVLKSYFNILSVFINLTLDHLQKLMIFC